MARPLSWAGNGEVERPQPDEIWPRGSRCFSSRSGCRSQVKLHQQQRVHVTVSQNQINPESGPSFAPITLQRATHMYVAKPFRVFFAAGASGLGVVAAFAATRPTLGSWAFLAAFRYTAYGPIQAPPLIATCRTRTTLPIEHVAALRARKNVATGALTAGVGTSLLTGRRELSRMPYTDRGGGERNTARRLT